MDEETVLNIRAGLKKAEEKLSAARILLAAGSYADCVSRAYYAAFHAAESLLLTEGLEPRTREGVKNLLAGIQIHGASSTCLLATLVLTVSMMLWPSCGPVREELLVKYPKKHLDRPYTLPRRLGTWEISSETTFEKVEGEWRRNYGILPYPLIWRSSPSDNFNLFFTPLPTGFAYQIYRLAADVVGTSAQVGTIGYSRYSGWLLRPIVDLYWRRNLNTSTALEIIPSLNYSYRSRRSDNLGAELAIGPRFQLTDALTISVRPFVQFCQSLGSRVSNQPTSRNLTARVPLVASMGWSFGRLWSVAASYQYHSLDLATPVRHELLLNLIRYRESKTAGCKDVECADSPP